MDTPLRRSLLRRRNYAAIARNLSGAARRQGPRALKLGWLALRKPGPVARLILQRLGAVKGARGGVQAAAPVALTAQRWSHITKLGAARAPASPAGRPRLAYVSPLPPDRTGIADYSAALLPELARHYDVVLIGKAAARQGGKSYAWFRANAHRFDRVLYQMGNSPFHAEMIALLERIPGVVVLHDAHLGDLGAYLQGQLDWRGWWPRELYFSHGYGALAAWSRGEPGAELVRRYAASGFILRQADGVLVHSAHAKSLLTALYGAADADRIAMIPFVPGEPLRFDRTAARRRLGLDPNALLVCTFGAVAPSKGVTELVAGWCASEAARRRGARLVLVGQGEASYEAQLRQMAEAAGVADTLTVTGYATRELYSLYLAAADVAVQLRVQSHGETSGALYDALTGGLPTIVNAHGSFAELPDEAVLKIAEAAPPEAVASALDRLAGDPAERRRLGAQGRAFANANVGAARAAEAYVRHIEHFAQAPGAWPQLLAAAVRPAQADALRDFAAGLPLGRLPAIFVDVSALAAEDLGTGVQRVVRAQLLGLIANPSDGYRVEPVRCCAVEGRLELVYARRFTAKLLRLQEADLRDEVVSARSGDILYMPDLAPDLVVQAQAQGLFGRLRRDGVKIATLVHDLLPLQLPECFPPGAQAAHGRWMRAMAAEADLLIGVSRAVTNDIDAWLAAQVPERRCKLRLAHLHHGYDIAASAPTRGLPANGAEILSALQARPTFVMLGTIEPRKGYGQALTAFEQLWREGVDVNLAIVGAEGWRPLTDEDRRDIPQIVSKLKSHQEAGRRLFWLQGASDEYLAQIFEASDCLIAASLGEGFGLPLIEAAQAGLPILARDIPVFREVAGDYATYFSGATAEALSQAVVDWLAAGENGGRRPEAEVEPLTWAQNVEGLKGLLMALGSGHAPARDNAPLTDQA